MEQTQYSKTVSQSYFLASNILQKMGPIHFETNHRQMRNLDFYKGSTLLM